MSNNGSNATKTPNVVTSESSAKLELTAYQGGQAVFREKRVVALIAGRNHVFLAGLPAQVDPNSLTVTSVEGEGKFKMGPVSHRPANLTPQAILLASVGTTVTLIEQTPQGQVRTPGKLLHVLGNQVVLEQADGHTLLLPLTPKYELSGPVPAGLSALSSLFMEPTVSQDGNFGINVLYEAEGISWTPRYEVFYDAAGEKLTRFACYVSLTNNTGRTLEDAVFKLIAGYNQGNTRRAHARSARMMPMAASATLESAGGAADFSVEGAAVESVGEQKMYTLPEALTMQNGDSKETALVFGENVPVEPLYYLPQGYYGDAAIEPADLTRLPISIRLRLKNDAASNLGIALPPGEVRVLEPDSSGALQKTDTSSVSNHVSVDEAFRLDLRNPCRDLKATRRLTFVETDPEEQVEETPAPAPDSPVMRPLAEATAGKREKKQPKPRFRTEERETVLHNFKDKAVEVNVYESFPLNADFLSNSHEFAQKGQADGFYAVNVPGKGSAKVTYRIKYRIN